MLKRIAAYCWMYVLISLALFVLLGGCAGSREPPLAVIHEDDPTWELRPDHLENGELPK